MIEIDKHEADKIELRNKIIQMECELAKAEAALKVYEEAVEFYVDPTHVDYNNAKALQAQQKVKEILGSEG